MVKGPYDLVLVEDPALVFGLDAEPFPIQDVVAMQTRQPNLEGTGEITLRRLIKEALRMRPDRLVVGEVRGARLDLVSGVAQGIGEVLAGLHDGGGGVVVGMHQAQEMLA